MAPPPSGRERELSGLHQPEDDDVCADDFDLFTAAADEAAVLVHGDLEDVPKGQFAKMTLTAGEGFDGTTAAAGSAAGDDAGDNDAAAAGSGRAATLSVMSPVVVPQDLSRLPAPPALPVPRRLTQTRVPGVRGAGRKRRKGDLPLDAARAMGEATMSYAMGDPEAAVISCLEAIRLCAGVDPPPSDPFTTLGLALEDLGRDTEALEVMEIAAVFSTNDPTQNDKLGELALKTGDFKKAIRYFSAAARSLSTMKRADSLRLRQPSMWV
jgi:tetratricopeptide (TPR) repeat protein